MSSLCFVCELPVQSHQTWNTWKTNLLSPTPIPKSSSTNYVNNVYHEDCLVCGVCSLRLKQNSGTAKRYGNKIYCALHYADVSGIGTGGEEFMNKLRDFKRQSLGCAEARRKSSTTLSFPVPVQACPGSSNCSGFPHDIKPTSGYWVECKGGLPGEKHEDKKDQHEHPNSPNTEAFLASSSLHRSNTSSEGLFLRKLERSDTSKSTSDMEPMCSTLHPPTIQIIDSSHKSKDDLELYRKHGPNIIITMAQSVSPPPSPPAPSPGQTPQAPQTHKERVPADDPFE